MTKRSVSILERPVYGLSEAAALLGMRADRARAWLDGTERLWELFDAGESIEEIAGGYDMPAEQIAAAIAYEEQLRSLTA